MMYIILTINFLLAISTTVGMTIIPFLITDSLGLSLMILGIIEGSTEFISNLFRLTNGILFDNVKNKRLIFVSSTAFAFFAKVLLLLPSPWAVLSSKTLERVANGMFASPRDAFVASNAIQKGRALSLLNISKALGCILGPLIVATSTFFIGPLKNNLTVFVGLCCCLTLPAFLMSFSLTAKSVTTVRFAVREIKTVFEIISPILILIFLFFLGRFNDGLLMMYLKQNEFPEWFYLSTIAIFNSIMLITSPQIGKLIDKENLKKAVYITLATLTLFNICFLGLNHLNWVFAILGLFCWGTQRACAQIVFSALIFRSVKNQYYGTAIGLFYIVSGIATMIASFICGYLANHAFISVFLFSGFFAFLSMVLAYGFLNKKLFATPGVTANAI